MTMSKNCTISNDVSRRKKSKQRKKVGEFREKTTMKDEFFTWYDKENFYELLREKSHKNYVPNFLRNFAMIHKIIIKFYIPYLITFSFEFDTHPNSRVNFSMSHYSKSPRVKTKTLN